MADTTPDFLRGFLVPLGLGSNNVWTAQSTNTVADERAGDPIAQQNNPMQLIAKGRQSGASDITIKTQSYKEKSLSTIGMIPIISISWKGF